MHDIKTQDELLLELEALRTSEAQYRLLLDESTDPIFNISPDGLYLYVNREFASGVGIASEKIIGRRLWDVFTQDEADKRFTVVKWVCENSQPKVFEVLVPHPNGDRYYITSVKPIIGSSGQTNSVICISKEITERKKFEQRLTDMATLDSLTAVANRRYFLELAEQELARVKRYKAPFSIAIMDIDHFKTINDTYGHQAGDKVLQETIVTCRNMLREFDVIGRMGGEEFAFMFPETDAESAHKVAERICNAVANASFPIDHNQLIHVTISIGVASHKDVDTALDKLFNRADKALYEAKRSGRNRVVAST